MHMDGYFDYFDRRAFQTSRKSIPTKCTQ